LSRNILRLFYIEKQGLAMHFGKEDGSTAALLKISSFFGRVTRQEGILGHISATPLRHAFFQNAL